MGDLMRAEERSRGQLLIITALTLAVLLSALTLSLNTAVFGGAYVAGTDDGSRAERGASGFQDAVERGVAGLIPRINGQYDEYDAQESALADATANWSEVAADEYARDSVATDAAVTDVTFRTRIVQNDSRKFTDRSNNRSWTVAENVSGASGHEMNVTDQGLVVTEAQHCINDSSDCFTLTVDNGSESWEMFVYEDNSSHTVSIAVKDSAGNVQVRNTTGSSVVIDVTNGTFDVGGSSEDFTTYTDDVGGVDGPYTLRYENADNVEGTYNLTVTGRIVDGLIANDGRYATESQGDSPWLDPRIVAADVSVRYQSSTLEYGSEIRVTPGGGDD